MTMRATVLMVSTVCGFTLTAAAAARAQSPPNKVAVGDTEEGNADLKKAPMARELDAEMRRTGRVALPSLNGQGTFIPVADSLAQRPETKVRAALSTPRQSAPPRVPLREVPNLDFQYGKTIAAALDQCPFQVARELAVAPSQIAAGVVTFYWTIEPSGRVRDISAVASSLTDEAVMECAKRVVISRVLLNPVPAPVALEWTYSFPTLPGPKKVTAQR